MKRESFKPSESQNSHLKKERTSAKNQPGFSNVNSLGLDGEAGARTKSAAINGNISKASDLEKEWNALAPDTQ
jgi:hypothetical protein